MTTRSTFSAGMGIALLSAFPAHAATTLLETLFEGAGSSVSGGTLSGFDYTTSAGLNGGAIAIDASVTTDTDNLFALNAGNSGSHFLPNVQINNGEWTADLALTVPGTSVTVSSIEIERQHFNNGAALNTNSQNRRYPMFVSLVGSTSGEVAIDSERDDDSFWGDVNSTVSFDMGGITLSSAETWDIRIQVGDTTPAGQGVYIGIDQLTVIGDVIPEPSTGLLAGLGLLGLLRRRRQTPLLTVARR